MIPMESGPGCYKSTKANRYREEEKELIDDSQLEEHTFIPGIWTHSTAVPVAFEINSAKVSSAMDKSLQNKI